MKTLPTPDQLAKTNFGVIQSLDELFEGFLYCRQEFLPNNGGCRTIHPQGWFFCGAIDTFNKVVTFPPGHRHPGPCLYAKPTPKALEAVLNRAMEGRMGSFSLHSWSEPPTPENPRTPWTPRPGAGYTLIMGTDSTMIPNVWLGFIDTDNLPAINPDNTKIWSPK